MFFEKFKIPYVFFLLIFSTFGLIQDDLKKKLQQMLEAKLSSYENVEDFQCKPFIDFEFSLPHSFKMDLIPDTLTKKLENMLTTVNSDVRKHVSFTINVKIKNNGFNYIQSIRIHFDLTDDALKCLQKWKIKGLKMDREDSHLWCIKTIGWHVKRTGILRNLGKFELSIIDMKNKKWRQTLNYLFGKAKYELEADQKNPTNILINLIPPQELNPEEFLVMLQHVHESVRPKFKGVQSIKYLVQPIMHGNKMRYLDMIIFGSTLNEAEEETKKNLHKKCNKHLISHLHQEYKTLGFECASVFNAVEVDKAKTTENWYRLVVRVRNRKPGHNLDPKTISKIIHETGIGNNEKLSFESSYNGFDYADQKKDYLILTFKGEELTATVDSVTTQDSSESTTPISSSFTELIGRARATYKTYVTTPESKNETETIIAASQSSETTQGFSDDATSILPPITDPEQKTETPEQVLFLTDETTPTPKSFQESKATVARSLSSKTPESSEDSVTSSPTPLKDLGQSCLCLGRKTDSPEQVLSSTDGLQESEAKIATSLSYKTSESSGESGTSILPPNKDIGQKIDSFTQIISSANVTSLKSVEDSEATIATPPIPITSSILPPNEDLVPKEDYLEQITFPVNVFSAESVQKSMETTPTLSTISENGPGFSTLILSSFEDLGRKADFPTRVSPSVEKVSLVITTSQTSKSTGGSSDTTTSTLLPIKDSGKHTYIDSTESAKKSSMASEGFSGLVTTILSPIEDPFEGSTESATSIFQTIKVLEQKTDFSTHVISPADVFSTQSIETSVATITSSPTSSISGSSSDSTSPNSTEDPAQNTSFPTVISFLPVLTSLGSPPATITSENESDRIDAEDMDSNLYIQKIIALEMVPLLFGKYPTSELTFRILKQPGNYSICGVNRIWKIVLKFESEEDGGPYVSGFEEILNDIFKKHSNISRIKYIFDFTKKRIQRDLVDVYLCFNQTKKPDFKETIESDINETIGADFNKRIEPNSKKKIEAEFNNTIEPDFYKATIKPDFNETVDPDFKKVMKPDFNKKMEPFFRKLIEPDFNMTIELNSNKSIKPDSNNTTESDFKKKIEPDFNKTTIKPDFDKPTDSTKLIEQDFNMTMRPDFRRTDFDGSVEPNFNKSIKLDSNNTIESDFKKKIEPDFNKTIIKPNFDKTIQPDFRKLIEPDFNKTMEPFFRKLIEPVFNMTIKTDFRRTDFDGSVEPNFNKSIKPDSNNTKESYFKKKIEPDFNKTTVKPDYDKTIVPDFNKTMEPFFRKLIEPDFNMRIEPDFRTTDFDGSVEPSFNKSIKPDSNNTIESDFKKEIKPDFNKTIQSDFKKLIEPDFNKTMEPFFRKLIEPDFDGSLETNFNKSIKPDSNNTIKADFNKKIEPDFNKTTIKPDFDKTTEPDSRKLIELDFNKTMQPFFRKLIEPDFNMTIRTDFGRTDFDGSVNNTIESDFNKKIEPDFNREDFIRGILDTEIFPYADGFDPLHKPVTRILQKEEMVNDECKSDIFEVEVTDLGGGTCFSSMRTELLLLNLLEKYPQLRGSCLPLDSGFGYNNTLKICMNIAKRPKTCTMLKTTEMEYCGWKDEETAVIPPGGRPPLQNGRIPVIKGGAPPVGLTHKPYPKELKEKWLNNLHRIKAFMKNKGG